MAEIDSTHDMAGIDAIIHDLRESHASTTAGEWGKGQTTHETVSRQGRDGKYKIADFRHANDAQFCDLAHAFVPRLLNEVEVQAARIAQLEAQVQALRDDAERFKSIDRAVSFGIRGPAHGRRFKLVECNMLTGEEEKVDLLAVAEFARAAKG